MQCCMRRPMITQPNSRGGRLDTELGAITPKLYMAIEMAIRICFVNFCCINMHISDFDQNEPQGPAPLFSVFKGDGPLGHDGQEPHVSSYGIKGWKD